MSKQVTLINVICLLLVPSFGHAEVIPARADGYIQHSGSNGLSTVVDSEQISTWRSGGSNIRHGIFEFDLREFQWPEGANIDAAALQFELTQTISNTRNEAEVAFYGYASDGQIDSGDYDTPTSDGSRMLSSVVFPARTESPSIGTLLTIDFEDLTPLRNAIADGHHFFTVRSETVNFVTFEVGATENATAVPPSLIVTTDILRGDFNSDGVVDILDIDAMSLGDSQYDLTNDDLADADDLDLLVSTLIGTWFGDSNGDSEFESGDLVQVFAQGKFETGMAATWGAGDWNKDGVFNTQDFVKAFSDGGFERGARIGSLANAAPAVPEPHACLLLLSAVIGISCFARPAK